MIGFLVIGIIVYILSYIIVRAWRNLPASRKVWFWFGIISLVAALLWCSFLFWLKVQAGNVLTLPQGLLLILLWSAVILTGLLFLYSLRGFIRWLMSWRILKGCLMVFVSLAFLGCFFTRRKTGAAGGHGIITDMNWRRKARNWISNPSSHRPCRTSKTLPWLPW